MIWAGKSRGKIPDAAGASGEWSFLLRLDGADQVLGGDAVELGELQEVGGGGVGGAVFPFAHGLTADIQGFGYEFLGHGAAGPVVLQHFAQRAAEDFCFLPLGAAVQILVKCPENQNQQPDEDENEKADQCDFQQYE